MNVFEVTIDREKEDSAWDAMVEYITCSDNSFTTATSYAQNLCDENGYKLVSVKHILTVVKQISTEKEKKK